MVDPAAHSHEAPIEVLADAVAAKPITAVTVRFPEEFGKVLVVSYQPKQVWVDRKGQEIHF